jgi:hypothetical protein
VTGDNIVQDNNDTQAWNRFSYVRNNPTIYKDPTGHVIETAWDVVSVAIGAGQLIKDTIDLYKGKGSTTNVATSAAALALDVTAAALPFIPGGASVAWKTARTAIGLGKKVEWSAKAVKAADITIASTKAVNEGIRGYNQEGEKGGIGGAIKGATLEILGKQAGRLGYKAISTVSTSHVVKKIGGHVNTAKLEHAEKLINKTVKMVSKGTGVTIPMAEGVNNTIKNPPKVDNPYEVMTSMGI